MTRLHLTALSLLILSSAAFAQVDEPPVFGPPRTEPRPTADAAPQDEPRPTGTAALIERLSRWPEAPGQEAARALVLEGGGVVPLLVSSLKNNDWRIRCGVAWALGELREQSAFPELQKSAHDIANRINARPFFDAMVKIDPIKATAEILGFVSSTDARVAKDAFEALPAQIDTRFEPRIVELARDADATVRQRALLLTRHLSRPAGTDLYFEALADPAPRVACIARDLLADRNDPAVHDRLLSTLLEAALRPAGYSALALVMIEDRSNRVLLTETPELKRRLLVFLNVRGEFENAVGAIAFANISMRSSDPEIRAFADGSLMDILLGSAAGGLIFRDYHAVKTLAFRKAAEVSGENFGEDADRWLAWRRDTRETFRARRELRRLRDEDLARMLFRYSRRVGDRSLSVAIKAGEPGDDLYQVIRPVYVDLDEIRALAGELDRLEFFKKRGMQRDADWAGDFVDVSVTVDAAEFRRAHYGAAPEDLVELEGIVRRIVEKERWQSFFGSTPASQFRSWFLEQRGLLDAKANEAERLAAVAELALDAYPGSAPQARREALAAWRAAGPAFLAGRGDRFLALLGDREIRPERATELLDVLAERPGLDTTATVVKALPLFSAEGRKAALAFLARRPSAEIVALESEGQPELGALLVEALAARTAEPGVVARIIGLLGSPDPRVLQAVRGVFPEGAPPALLQALRAEVAAAEPSRRFRLIEIWGAITAADDLADLEVWFGEGSLAQQQAVVRALGRKSSPEAVERLFDLARTSSSREIRLEAQGLIATSESAEVRQRMRLALGEIEDEERLLEFFRAASELFRADAEAELGKYLLVDKPVLRRQAALLLAPRLVTSCIPELLAMLLDKTESSRAWEYLELITCREFAAISAEEAYVAYERFWKEHKEEEQSRWFMTALDNQGMPSSNLLGYLNGNMRDLRSIALLLKTLQSDKWFLRVNAHIHLGRIRGEPLGRLARNSTPAEIERVRNRWNEWYKALLADL